jgi:hypothetical protein
LPKLCVASSAFSKDIGVNINMFMLDAFASTFFPSTLTGPDTVAMEAPQPVKTIVAAHKNASFLIMFINEPPFFVYWLFPGGIA